MSFLFARELNDNYGIELSGLRQVRDFEDGVTFFEFKVNWDRYLADHSPRVELYLEILNFSIIECSIHYLHHRDEVTDNV